MLHVFNRVCQDLINGFGHRHVSGFRAHRWLCGGCFALWLATKSLCSPRGFAPTDLARLKPAARAYLQGPGLLGSIGRLLLRLSTGVMMFPPRPPSRRLRGQSQWPDHVQPDARQGQRGSATGPDLPLPLLVLITG